MHPMDEVAEHLFGDDEVGNHAVLQGADGGDVAGRSTEHALGLDAHRRHLLLGAVVADGDDRRLVQDDALFLDIDERIGRAKVD